MIPKLPAIRNLEEMTRLLNDRLGRIGSELGQRYRKGEDIDLNGNRIKNAADPIDPGDVLNRAAADRRFYQPPAQTTAVSVVAAGTAGTANVAFSAALYEYGAVTVEGVTITGATGIGTFKGLTFSLFFVDEMTADVYVSLNANVGSSDPLIVGCTPNPNRTTSSGVLDFAAGQTVLFDDAGSYELAKITNIASGTFTFQRQSILGSSIADHSSGTRVFIVQERKFTFAPAGASYDAGSDIITVPDRMDCWLPNACVVAIVASAQFGDDTGPRTITNTALADVPGLRTLHGGNYSWTLAGNASVGLTSAPKRVQFESSIRVAFARVTTAPAGAALIVAIERSVNNGAAWTTLASISIASGATESFDFAVDPPGPKRVPYSDSWPFAVLLVDNLLRIKVTQIGSTTAGANVAVELYT